LLKKGIIMKIRFIVVAIGLSLALSAARANDVLEIAEVGENFADITVTLNGTPVAVALTGAADNWTIEFPAGFNVSFNGEVALGEPENPSLFNSIFSTQPTFITWTSDLAGVPGTIYQNPITLLNNGSFMNNALDMVFVDRPGGTPVPDTSSTVILLGMSLAGLVYFASMRKAAV
jgi:hypothetical protein